MRDHHEEVGGQGLTMLSGPRLYARPGPADMSGIG